MLIKLNEVLDKYNLKPKGVIHVGAHWAEEHEDYLKWGIEKFVYIEPCKEAFQVMMKKFMSPMSIDGACKAGAHIGRTTDMGNGKIIGIAFYNVACGVEESESVMYVSHNNQGQSNSLLQPSLHLSQHPEIVFTDAEVVRVVPLDRLGGSKRLDMLVLDVQGFEGNVLKGGVETLKHINIVYTEVNNGETYVGNTLIEEMDELLHEFERVQTYWPSPNWTWGDAVYIRKTLL